MISCGGVRRRTGRTPSNPTRESVYRKEQIFRWFRMAASDGVSGNTSSEPTTESAKKMSLRRKRLFLRLLVMAKLTLRKTPAKTGAEFQKKQDNL